MPNGQGEIEELFVAIRGDIAPLMDDTKKGVGQAAGELGKFEQAGKRAFDNAGRSAQGLTATVQKLQAAFVALAAVVASMKIGGFFVDLVKGAVAANSQFETFRTQFETLLGSQAAAQQRIEELAQFGVETPFELPEVVQASRLLETFGGAALATGENLRMVGDIAAGVNQPFADVAMWVGRMYDAMQSGRPFGEAAMRLQEMGALSGQARAEIERLQKAGASGAELWAAFNELIGSRFAGNMERLSKTLQGITSNLADFQGNLMRVGGEAAFEQVRGDAERLLNIVSSPDMRRALENLAQSLGEAAAMLESLVAGPALDALENVDPAALERLAESLRDLIAAVNEFLGTDFTADLNGAVDALTILSDLLTTTTNDLNNVKAVLEPVDLILQAIKDTITGILFPITNLVNAFGALRDIVAQITGKDLADFSRDMAESSQTQKQLNDELSRRARETEAVIGSRFGGAGGGRPETPEGPEPVDKEAEEVQKRLQELGSELLDIQAETGAELEQAASEHSERMIEIESDYVQTRLELGSDMADEFEDLEADVADKPEKILEDFAQKAAELEQETTDRRAEIISDAREELAELAQETDEQLADERAEFNEEERRETEDHLRDMRRLREQYLFDLEGAVAARDARAIVDLRRRFQQESAEREEDFTTRQDRERQDQDQRLAEIRDNERRRADEIMQAREEQLAELEENERQRLAKLETSRDQDLTDLLEFEAEKTQAIRDKYAEQFADLDIATAEAKAKEIASYNERQVELESALAKRLEAEAKALADSDKINDEGAAQILGTLAKYFGEDGEIDNLMASFRERQRQKMKIQIEFEGGTSETGSGDSGGVDSGGGVSPDRTFAAGGSMIATRPTLVQFGEVPELATFTPLGQAGGSMEKTLNLNLNLSGSAPPGIRAGDRDEIAGVLVNALREAGMMR